MNKFLHKIRAQAITHDKQTTTNR